MMAILLASLPRRGNGILAAGPPIRLFLSPAGLAIFALQSRKQHIEDLG